MKKLISIGVALALLTMAVVPGAVAAQPETYAKTPFAIIEEGFDLIGTILDSLGTELGLPEWLDSTLMGTIGDFAGGPLSWTVDMLGWGVWIVGDVIAALDPLIGAFAELPFELSEVAAIFNTLACDLFTPWGTFDVPPFNPCA